MDAATESFVSQLKSAALIACGATSTDAEQRSWIASVGPSDDARQIIPDIRIIDEQVEDGEEGATIEIEPIEPEK